MRRFMILASLVALVACEGNGVDDTGSGDSGDSGDSGNSGDSGDTGQKDDGVSPYVEEGTVTCYTTGGSSDVMTWWLAATGNDPQGPENLKRFGGNAVIIFNKLGAEIYRNNDGIVCTDEGACSGSVKEVDAMGALCAKATDFTFQIILSDDDGNTSNPYTLEYFPTST